MALKKSQLYSYLWQSCDELRGGMDASQYKDYILTLLFVKYVTDKAKADKHTLIEVPKGGSFDDMVKLKGDKEIGDKVNKIISRLAEANDLKGVIDQADFNDEAKLGKGKEMQDRLSSLIGIFENLDFSANKADGDDLLGDAYEYLMRNFATQSGKSKGQFYTPAEVSRVMAQVIGIEKASKMNQPTVYDPTCGSGSLLIKAADIANTPKLAIYGQEIDVATWALAKMNMILHGYPTADIQHGNTLSTPYFTGSDGSLKTFDFAVANPPFSQKNWTNGLDPENDIYHRFEYGIPPEKNGDYAFLLHLIKSLKSTGKGAIILPHGVLFRGNREADIRKNLIDRGLIKGIIGLPDNLFYGTGIPACIIVVDKESADKRQEIFFIDASKGYIKDGNKNRLREQDIRKIVDVFRDQIEIQGYSRLVSIDEIKQNEYNLNIPRYIDNNDPEDIHNLYAHLNGGIPEDDVNDLKSYWNVFPSLRDTLFQSNGKDGYLKSRIPANEVKSTILDHPEYRDFQEKILERFNQWKKQNEPKLKSLKINGSLRDLIRDLSNDLLTRFDNLPLIDKYDIYQILMDYWNETMQDDVYLIAAVGWLEASKPRSVVENRDKKLKETADLILGKTKYKMDLIPPDIITETFFATEKEQVEQLTSEAEAASQSLDEFVEENTTDPGDGEASLLAEVMDDNGKITKDRVKARLKELTKEDQAEKEALTRWLELAEHETQAKKKTTDAQAALNQMAFEKYADLTETQIQELVVDRKWMATLEKTLIDHIHKIGTQLVTRIKELEERYARPLPEIAKEVEEYTKKVEEHLKKMGVIW